MNQIFSEVYKKFVKSLEDRAKSRSTIIAYAKDIEQFLDFCDNKELENLDSIKMEDINEFKDLLLKQRYKDKSVARKINSIKGFFKFAKGENYVKDNPAFFVTQPKFVVAPPRILSKNEYKALRDACRGDLRMLAIVELFLQTGMRISELASLKIDDISFEKNYIDIDAQNSHKSRRVPLNSTAKAIVTNYLQIRPQSREKVLFLTKTCRPFLIRNIRTSVERYFKMAGIYDATVNDLRHTFIVEQLKAGVPLIYVSQLVGHKSIVTTEKYLQFLTKDVNLYNIKIEEL
jgi:site-specific recombinase XerD